MSTEMKLKVAEDLMRSNPTAQRMNVVARLRRELARKS